MTSKDVDREGQDRFEDMPSGDDVVFFGGLWSVEPLL